LAWDDYIRDRLSVDAYILGFEACAFKLIV